jgi:hypothetical protein
LLYSCIARKVTDRPSKTYYSFHCLHNNNHLDKLISTSCLVHNDSRRYSCSHKHILTYSLDYHTVSIVKDLNIVGTLMNICKQADKFKLTKPQLRMSNLDYLNGQNKIYTM